MLDPSKMHGQAYDGASNMSGKISGAAARIQSQYPLALYTHCASYCFILAVDASFQDRSVRNNYDWCCEVTLHLFSAHPKYKKLGEAIQKNAQPESNVVKLKFLCRARWIECIDALNCVKKFHSLIVVCFENIYTESSCTWSADTVTDVLL